MTRPGYDRKTGKESMGRTGKILALAAAAALALAGCGQGSDSREPGNGNTGERPLKVAATLFPYYDFARQIGGDVIDLELIIPAGVDSHSFEPTPADMKKLQEADVVICNGGAMEHWVSQVMEALDSRSITVVVMMDYVDVFEEELVEGMEEAAHSHGREAGCEEGHDHDDTHGAGCEEGHGHDDGREAEYDEHIWTSPVNAMKLVRVIAEVLAERDPAHRDVYEEGRDRYIEELREIHEGFLKVAEERKRNTIIIGDKFPFRYLAEEYGFDYRAAFSGCSTDTEPAARTIAYLIDRVDQEKIPAVYYLELGSHRVSEIIGEETGAAPMLLHSCHNVTRKELEAGITYAELMRQNIENLRKGLDE